MSDGETPTPIEIAKIEPQKPKRAMPGNQPLDLSVFGQVSKAEQFQSMNNLAERYKKRARIEGGQVDKKAQDEVEEWKRGRLIQADKNAIHEVKNWLKQRNERIQEEQREKQSEINRQKLAKGELDDERSLNIETAALQKKAFENIKKIIKKETAKPVQDTSEPIGDEENSSPRRFRKGLLGLWDLTKHVTLVETGFYRQKAVERKKKEEEEEKKREQNKPVGDYKNEMDDEKAA